MNPSTSAPTSYPESSSTDFIARSMQDCTLCPRNCHADRQKARTGYCGQTAVLMAARAALHFWEEPCISGSAGSGAVFFSGCNLCCVFCQNQDISMKHTGTEIPKERLVEIFLELQEKGAHNINLVTPTHYVPQITHALQSAKKQGLRIPIVYNTGSYEKRDTLKMLDGLIDIYLPDLKYYSSDLSLRFSHAADYFEKATEALSEMYRQVGTPVFAPAFSKDGIQIPSLMQRGMIVRHLILPGQTKDSKKILRYLHETYRDNIYISILNQYTPLPCVKDIAELNRPVSDEEYDRIMLFAERIGISRGFYQEKSSVGECYIPEFHNSTGVI